jgi:hypothetical protein
MALVLNGSGSITGLSAGGLPDGSVTADDIASTLDLSGKTVTLPAGVGGKVLQMVSSTSPITTNPTTTSNTYVNSGMFNEQITPVASNSKIIVMFSGYHPHIHYANGNRGGALKIYRSVNGGAYSATIATGHQEGYYHNNGSSSEWLDFSGHCRVADTPSYTLGQAITYQLWFRKVSDSSGSFYANHSGGVINNSDAGILTSILMEIAA